MRLRASVLPPDEAGPALQGLMRAGARARNPHLHRAAADEFRKAGRDAEAAAEYEAALALDPGDAFALAQVGFCYKRMGQTDKVLESLRRALLRDPRDRFVRVSLGALGRSSGRVSELLRWIEEALKLHPDVGELYGFRKEVLKRVRAEDAAAADAPGATAGVAPADTPATPRRRKPVSPKSRPAS